MTPPPPGEPGAARPSYDGADREATLPPPVPPPADDSAVTVGASLPMEVNVTADLVPGYEIQGELGRGGMGVVYKARQIRLNRLVALKMILAGGHAGQADLARFHTEAEAIAHLQHPNIIQVHEIGEHDGKPFFSLEFCTGGSLDRKLDGTPLKPQDAAQLVQTLARAMHAAHEKNVIHRDLKPANVLLAEDGTPKITDFGLAKKLDDVGQTATGAIMGTPSYMAPEQASGLSKAIGPAADIYALGAILYELLAGRPPFKAASALDTILQVVGEEPVPLQQLQSRTPKDLDTICLKCLAKEPTRRYATALDLADDLQRWQDGEPILARPVGRLERAVKWVKRNPVVAGLLVAVLLVFAAGTLVSTLFALEARRRASDLAEAMVKVDANARQAEQKEREANNALAEVEKVLLDSLLRSVGRQAPTWNDKGQNETPLDPAEFEALRQLGGLSIGSLRLRFLEVGLRNADTAERLGLRADWVVQAVVGLDAGQRRDVEKLLMSRLREKGSGHEVRLACVRLGHALELREKDFLEMAGDVLVDAMVKTGHAITLNNLARLLSLVIVDLDPSQAAVIAARGAEVLIAAAVKPIVDVPLTHGLEALSGRLNREDASKLAQALLDAMTTATDHAALFNLAESVQGVSGGLDPTAAAGPVGKAAMALVEAMNKTSEPNTYQQLGPTLGLLSGRLDHATANKAARALIEAMGRTDNSLTLSTLSECLESVCSHLEASQAAIHAGKASDILLDEMGKTSNPEPLFNLASGLKTLSEKLEASQARRCSDKASQRLLAVMGKTTDARNVSNLGQAIVLVSQRLEADEAAQYADKAAQVHVENMSKTTSSETLLNLANTLETLCGRLKAAPAAVHAGKASDALLKVAAGKTRPEEILNLAMGMMGLSEKLETAQARRCAGKASQDLFALMGKTNNPVNLAILGQAIALVNQRRDVGAADPCVAEAAKLLVNAMGKTTNPETLFNLASALKAVNERLEASQAERYAGQASRILRDMLTKTTDLRSRISLAWGLRAFSGRLELPGAGNGAEVLVEAMARNEANPLQSLPEGLSEVGARLSTPELVLALQHPLAGGQVQRILLDVLAQRTRREFRNPWHFLDWASANGVDLAPKGEGKR
jgi:Protein kinase domain